MVVKVFIGGLPPSADDSTVAELLSAFGRVETVTLSRDPATLLCAGYGFAKLSSEDDANKVIAALHNQVKFDPEGHPGVGMIQLRIIREADQPQTSSSSTVVKPMKLFMGGVPSSATGKSLRTIFQPYGEILDLFIAPEKGYAFVKFSSASEALAAMAAVNGTMLPNAVRPLEVRIAQSTKGLDAEESEAQLTAAAASIVPTPSRRSDWAKYATEDGRTYYHNKITNKTQWEEPLFEDEAVGGIIGLEETASDKQKPAEDKIPIGLDKGPPGSNIFTYGLPDKWREKEFAEEFRRFGEIVSIKVIYDRTTGTSKGYGFISYSEPGAAEAAVRAMHGTNLGGRRLKVQIKRGEDISKPY
jgi:CUG-BP- and ETR3-like factor